MASRLFKQFLYSLNPMLSYIEGSFNVGATGAVSGVIGSGVDTVTRLKAGVYQIVLQDNYNRIVDASFDGIAGVTGASVAAGSLVTGTLYSITAVGSTDWTAITGYPDEITAAIGVSFVAGGTGSGTGTAKAVGTVGWDSANLMGNPNKMIYASNQGALVLFQTVLAGTVADPTNGSSIRFGLWLRNSSVLGKGETASNF